ncbi:MAG TPA: XRE family transcriptional regulator [Candidatus Sulfotelmatobacter sp.]|nr:XRE family transcriptional regulator [Candidatus Sulfotelmatobacter sp.]
MTRDLPLPLDESQDIQGQLSSFGARLRQLRLQRGLTLKELAAHSGLSRAFLSRLESGDRQASISAALTLAKIFNISLASLFEPPVAEPQCAIFRCSDAVEKTVNGLKYTPLSDAGRMFNVQPIRVKISPSRPGNEHYHHDGEEWIYVLHGKLTLSLVGKTYDLEEGDAAHFESRLPHRLIARGGREAEVLVVAAPDWNTPPKSGCDEHRSIPVGGLLSLPEGWPVGSVSTPSRRKSGAK